MMPGWPALEPGLCVALPLLAALLHALWGGRQGRAGAALAWVGVGAAAVALGLLAHLAWTASPRPDGPGQPAGGLWLTDRLALVAALLVATLGLAAALLALGWVPRERAAGRLGGGGQRLVGAALQAVLGFTLLGLLADPPALTAAAAGAATLAASAATALGGRRDGGVGSSARARLAAWRLAVPGGAAALLALGGATLLALGTGPQGAGWSRLASAAAVLQGPGAGVVPGVAGALLLAGFVGLAGLVPLQGGQAPAQALGPLPVAGVLGLLVPSLALVTLLRLRVALQAIGAALPGGAVLLGVGLASVLLGALALWHGDVRRRLAMVALLQNGVVATAFGLGGPGAVYAGVLHLVLHGLAQAGGQLALAAHPASSRGSGGGRGAGPPGLAPGSAARVPLAAAVLCLSGLAPLGLFVSAFLVLTEALRRSPVVALPLGLGLLLGGWGLLAGLLPRPAAGHAAGPAAGQAANEAGSVAGLPGRVACWCLLGLTLLLSLAMPPTLADWLTTLAETTAR